MENYNNGRVKKISEIENMEQALKDFAEGSEALYELLIFCYENGIETKACCSGNHEDSDMPYICFINDGLNYLNDVIDMCGFFDMEISYSSDFGNELATAGVYYIGEDNNSENFFINIKSMMEKSIEENNIKLPRSFEIINDIRNSISQSVFLRDDLEPSISITADEDMNLKYNFYMSNPYKRAICNTDETFESICKTIDEVDVNKIKNYINKPLKIELTLEQLDTYSKKVKDVFYGTKRTK